MVPWTLGNDGWLYRNGRNVARVVTTPEDAGALVEAANRYPALVAAARSVVEGSGYGVTATSWTGRNEHFTAVPQRLFDALRAAIEESPE